MKQFEKMLYSGRLLLMRSAKKRANYIREHHLFGSVGENCTLQIWQVPLYANLIHLHNNVKIASNVGFVTHDIIHTMLNQKFGGRSGYIERVGCIEIMDNVFIGSGTRILYNTRIGSNVIVGSGSLVNKDIPDNSVYAGVPARYICSFDEYVEKAKRYSDEFKKLYDVDKVNGVNNELAQKIYKRFCEEKDSK